MRKQIFVKIFLFFDRSEGKTKRKKRKILAKPKSLSLCKKNIYSSKLYHYKSRSNLEFVSGLKVYIIESEFSFHFSNLGDLLTSEV